MPEVNTNQPKYYPKTMDAIKMIQAGIDPADALKYSNFKEVVSTSAVAKIKQKARKYSLTQPSLVKTARNQIKRILNGEVREIPQQTVTKAGQVVDYTEIIAPSDSNILAAASMVYDRFEPVKGVQSEGGKGGNTYIDLSVINNTQVINDEPVRQVIDIIDVLP
jgi:hypothetical protein